MQFSVSALTYRFPNHDDVMTYFNWVNEKDVRLNSLNTNSVSLEDHKAWFRKKITSDSLMLIFFNGESPVGQVRADVQDGTALIDFSVDFRYRGQGIGSHMIATLIDLIKKSGGIINVKAEVKSANEGSKNVFIKNGFRMSGQRISLNQKVEEYQFQILSNDNVQ